MKIFRSFFLVKLLAIALYAQNSYINVTANDKTANLFLDDKLVGKVPQDKVKVESNRDIILEVKTFGSLYYLPHKQTINIEENDIVTYDIELKKTKGFIHLIGEDGVLYIDGVHDRFLNEENRLFDVTSSKNLKLEIYQGYKVFKTTVNITKNYTKENPLIIKYELIKEDKDINLFTFKDTVNSLMWEDTKEAKNSLMSYIDAKKFCQEYQLAGFEDWRLATIKELESLNNIKEKIYNGFGDKFYWSISEDTKDKSSQESNIFTFNYQTNISESKNRLPLSIVKGHVRCVREYYQKDQNN